MENFTDLEKAAKGHEDLLTEVMETTDMDNLALMRKINERLAA